MIKGCHNLEIASKIQIFSANDDVWSQSVDQFENAFCMCFRSLHTCFACSPDDGHQKLILELWDEKYLNREKNPAHNTSTLFCKVLLKIFKPAVEEKYSSFQTTDFIQNHDMHHNC